MENNTGEKNVVLNEQQRVVEMYLAHICLSSKLGLKTEMLVL